ncbi:MAG: DUF4331 domain-containing protein [Anaerolineae bacterium]|nr:DUF4331 domain-containing protein [Anaerolineae bacterium]
MKKIFTLGVLGLGMLALVFGLAPFNSQAADHLDAPGLTSPGGDGRLDITDVYAFQSPTNPANTVMMMNVNPAAGAISPTEFSSSANYQFEVTTNGQTNTTLIYQLQFSAPDGSGKQNVTLRKASPGGPAKVIATGKTGEDIAVSGGGTLHAGLFDDPFFFDLNAFLGAYPFCEAPGGTPGSSGADFFAGLNVSAIVLEVPSSTFRTSSIGVWGRTLVGGQQVDRMGRPAINTVFIPSDSKNAFNESLPQQDLRLFGQFLGDFAPVLLPDILTVDVSSSAGFLNGRQLADDVIDIELTVLGVPPGGDCVDANDVTFSATFPYLAPAH